MKTLLKKYGMNDSIYTVSYILVILVNLGLIITKHRIFAILGVIIGSLILIGVILDIYSSFKK